MQQIYWIIGQCLLQGMYVSMYIHNEVHFVVRLLRNHPLLRLFFLLYLLILHIWVFIILAMHTHSLELDTDPKQKIMNKIS